MPCNDLTELIQVTVDDADSLVSYRFVKRTCGQGVGLDTLLLDYLQGRSVMEVLALDPQEVLDDLPPQDGVEEFLSLKHLIAVQSALEVLTGAAAGGAEDICAAAEIAYEENAATLEAVIRLDIVTERIKSCGGCKGCGKPRKKRAKALFN